MISPCKDLFKVRLRRGEGKMGGGTGTGYSRNINTRSPADYLINFFTWNKKFPLNSKARINLATKIIAYDSDNTKNNSSVERMFESLVKESKGDHEKLWQLNSNTRYILQFTKLKGAFLENFLGYKRI